MRIILLFKPIFFIDCYIVMGDLLCSRNVRLDPGYVIPARYQRIRRRAKEILAATLLSGDM